MTRHVEWVLVLVLVAVTFFSIGIGRYPIAPAEVWQSLWTPGDDTSIAQHIVWQIRLPRILTALVAGGVLALAGATLQSVFKNPLVDPHIIGVTQGSAFGGTLAILLSLSTGWLIASTQFFGLIALLGVFALANVMGRSNRLMVILAGIILAGFFTALVSLLQYLADAEEKLPNIVFWLMGSFATADWPKLGLLAAPGLAAAALLFSMRWHINVLSLGEREARSLGVNIVPRRWAVLFLCAVLTASQVAVSGSIGWIGLVVPHIARFWVGNNNVRLMPTSFLLGAIVMLLVDDVARTLTSSEIPIGILTAIMGAPVFGYLLYRHRRSSYERD